MPKLLRWLKISREPLVKDYSQMKKLFRDLHMNQMVENQIRLYWEVIPYQEKNKFH